MTPDAILARMTLEEKVGQVMTVSFAGPAFSADAEKMVRDYHVGGIILFQQNLVNTPQVQQLTTQLQQTAAVPLFVSIDQEGGPVVRLTSGVTLFPSQMTVGATYSAAMAASVAREMARELLALGFNVNFAPVADVNSNPKNPVIGTRSYGSDPAAAGTLAAAAIEAIQQAGVVAVAKHFPGHGDADVDSHRALPLIDHSLERLEAVELPPFKAAIDARVDAIMTAHLLLPALEPDPKRSATLSSRVLGYLRERMGFQGLIVTDDLEMGAIVNDHGTAEAAKLAFKAGADVLLFRRNVAEQQKAHGELVSAVKNGDISMQRLDASVRRVLEAKARRGILTAGAGAAQQTATAPAAAQGATGSGAALEVARRGLTLVKNERGVLPFRLAEGAPVAVVYPKLESVQALEVMASSPSAARGTIAGPEPQTLGDAIKVVYPGAQTAPFGVRPSAEEREAALAAVRDARAVVIGSYNLHEYPAQATFLKSVLAAAQGKPMAVVALRLPYDLGELDAAPALLATYSSRPASLQAVAEALFGKGPAPAGHLPVPVAPRWQSGHGLVEWSRPDSVTAVR